MDITLFDSYLLSGCDIDACMKINPVRVGLRSRGLGLNFTEADIDINKLQLNFKLSFNDLLK